MIVGYDPKEIPTHGQGQAHCLPRDPYCPRDPGIPLQAKETQEKTLSQNPEKKAMKDVAWALTFYSLGFFTAAIYFNGMY